MNLVAYARYSSDNQREESITAQLRAIHEWANNNGHTIIKEYIDEALTARTDKRPNFIQMIEDSKVYDWDGVVVHKLDRFARNRYHSAMYKKILKSSGKRLYSVLEKLDDSPESIIMESVIEGMNEYYSANLSREVKKGLKENALVCKHNGGTPPLGYGVDKDLHYFIIEKEAAAVKIIFEKFLEGYTYPQICNILSKKHYKTKTGKEFGYNSIHDILKNEKYTGVYIYGYGSRAKKRDQPNEDIIKIEDGMPKIIEKGIFDSVQEKMKGRKNMGGSYKAKQAYFLSGLIVCGKCGHNYVGAAKSDKRIVYECSGKKTTKCDNSYIKKDYIEKLVLDKLKNILINENNLKILTERVNDMYKDLYKDSKNDKKETIQELNDINRKIANINNAIINGFYNSSMNEESRLLEQQKEIAERKLFMIENISKKTELSIEDIKSLLKDDITAIRNEDLDRLKIIVPKYVKKIVINPENIDIQVIFDNNIFSY
ncbi:MAG: recombinase family protein [Clostridia bacterium]|nr:recombinase family protein [Clostridia bacterium]